MKTYITNKKQYKKSKGRQTAVCLFWLAIWQAAAMAVAKPLILPGPWDTVTRLVSLTGEGEFYLNILWTLIRCLSAMALSFILGSLCAWLAYRSVTVRSLLTLPVGFFKAVPVMAIIIYVILLVSADWVAVIVCFLMCFPIVYTNILTGLDAMPEEFLELAYIYDLTAAEKVRYIYIPGIRPYVMSAVHLITGMSWKAVVAAEVLSIPKYSLGYEMMNSKYYLQTPTLFAYILVIVILSLTMEKLVGLILDRSKPEGYQGSRLSCTKGHRSRNGAEVDHLDEGKPQSAPDIVFSGVTKSFDGQKVLDGLDMSFDGAKVTLLKGPSGRGKTTIARLAAGLEKPDAGIIKISSEMKISFLFQEERLIPWLNIYDNMALGLLRDGGIYGAASGGAAAGGCKDDNVHMDRSPLNDPVIEMAKALEIDDAIWKLPEELSGGMKHRAALGRTFLANSNVMVMDEPFRGLDQNLKERIIRRLWKKVSAGKTVILITHNDKDAELMGEKTIEI